MDIVNSSSKPDREALVPTADFLSRALAAYQTTGSQRPGQEQPHDEGVSLSHYLWVLRRYRWYILTFVAICTISAFIISSRMRPIFESTATLDVDRDTPSGVVGDESHASSQSYDVDQFLATQVELLQSDSVLRPVAEKYNLPQHEYDTSFLHGNHKIPMPKGPVQLGRLKISRPLNTYLLKISYRSPDRVLAANVANGIAASYLEHSFEIRARATNSMTTFMEKQLDELRAKMERSELALAKFEKELNVINPEDKTNILSARLLQLNTEYTSAQGDRVRKEAAFNSTQSGSVDAAQASLQGDSLKKLQDRLNEASERFAQVKEQYGPNHPEYAKAEAQLREVQRQFDSGMKSVRSRTEVEYREAVNREAMLKQSVAQTKAEYDSLNERSFQYQNVKREADEDKKLYDELIRKIREASINSGFQNREVRLADAALPGNGPVEPKIPLNVMLTFLFSTIIAVGAAVLADVLDNTISDPEQVTRELHTNLIGSLPMSRDWKFRFGHADGATQETALVKSEAISPGTKMLEESVRVLHSSILLSDLDRRIRSVLITSVSPRDGKSTTAALLATTNAQQGKKTLLIDGDLRRPSMDRIFGISSPVGLSNVVLGEMSWRSAMAPSSRVPMLDILSSGPPSHRALELVGAGLEKILDEAARDYSLIIVDSSPLMNFAEPLQMASMVDGVVIVTVAGQTNRKALNNVLTRLSRLRANVIGLVLNKVTKDITENYEYYGYGKYAASYYAADREG